MKVQCICKIAIILTGFLLICSSLCAQTGNTGIGTVTPGSKLTVNGSFAGPYSNISTGGTVGANNFYVAYNGSSNGTLTLPAAISGTGNFSGRMYHFKNTGTATLTVTASGAELIDNQSGAGVASVDVPAGYYAFFINKGTTTGTTWELVLLSSSNSVPAAASTYPFSAVPTSTRQTCTASPTLSIKNEITYPQGTVINTGNALNTSNGRFTAPTNGFYMFYGCTQFDNSSVAGSPTFGSVTLYLVKNFGGSASVLVQNFQSNPVTFEGLNTSCVTYLNAGETVSMAATASVSSGSTFQVVVSSLYGYKIAN
jgi:hypothetical protein